MPPITYTLHVRFDENQHRLLAGAGYKLCLSKPINGKYNVICSTQNVANDNVFEWTDELQVFSARKFTDGAAVQVESNLTEISPGQTAVLDRDGIMQPASGPVSGKSFKVTNRYMPAYLGVSQNINGNQQPIYVEQQYTIVGSSENFTQVPRAIVFFRKAIESGTMFTETDSQSIEIVFMDNSPQMVSYVTDPSSVGGVSGMWVDGAPQSQASSLSGHEAEDLSLDPVSLQASISEQQA